MFVLFMNDLPQAVKCRSIKMTPLSTDAQSTLERYRQNWFVVNLKKTHLMVFGRTMQKFSQRKPSLTSGLPWTIN